MIHCHLRGVECDCRQNECRAAPAKAAPLITFTAKEQFFAMAMLTLFMISISYWALSSANEAYRKQALINQEDLAWKR
ncbi:hypothetical protein G6M04_14600 [Agrobacterium rhizogenes]|uniref:hypothetical protein n=1 Tax=Rhizobium rhizogenes TaxID=359 RepID=UPI001573ACD5|nr:hypothetical protein [Rhizobium rhizogenes]NTG48620.1 hypothetical protein [Rhizobium rhizogenes]